MGLAGVNELSDNSELASAANPFAGLKNDVGLVALGSGVVGVVAGLGMVMGANALPRADKQAFVGTVRKEDGAVWNGSMWVTAESWAAVNGPTA